MQKLKPLYLWWITVLLTATGAFWAYHAGFIATIWHEDITLLTSVVAALFFYCLLMQCRAAALFSYNHSIPALRAGNKLLDQTWFLSEIMMGIGLLGTVIGLIYMLQKTFGAGTVSADHIGSVIGLMWKGLGIALYTNVVGTGASIITKLSAFYIGYRNHAD
jgi:hypothetical protein